MLEPQRSTQPAGAAGRAPHRLVFGNRILDSLPSADAERLVPGFRRVAVARDHVVTHPGELVGFLHFPVDAFACSWMLVPGMARPVTVVSTGHRGVMEWSWALAAAHSPVTTTVVSPGSVWRLTLDAFERHQPHVLVPLRHMLARYASACILNTACQLACNAEHNVNQRLARWILWMMDECGHAEFVITHHQIAEIAAIRRPSISLALSQFQRAGLLRSYHGRLQILDRRAFEEMVCTCYWTIRHNIDALFDAGSGV